MLFSAPSQTSSEISMFKSLSQVCFIFIVDLSCWFKNIRTKDEIRFLASGEPSKILDNESSAGKDSKDGLFCLT